MTYEGQYQTITQGISIAEKQASNANSSIMFFVLVRVVVARMVQRFFDCRNEIPCRVTLWSFGRLDTPIGESNVGNFAKLVLHAFEPLRFGWRFLLEVQGFNRAELLAIGKSYFYASLSEVNHGDILLSPEVFFNFNHT
jgi:hypothetical protein